VLERLVRTHGGRRTTLTAALASGWRRADGAVPGDPDLSALLDHHGLARAFEHRERDELLHGLRAAGGIKAEAAARLGIDPAALDAALARLGASPDAERIRERRRADLRARATLAERVRLLVGDEPRLRDLGLLAEFEQDLRARLPEHVRALRGSGPLVPALARSLSLAPAEAVRLAARLGVELVPRGERAPTPERRPERPRRDARPTRPTAKAPSRPRETTPARGRPPPRGGGADRPRTPRRGRRG
jgi:hypothetical protein